MSWKRRAWWLAKLILAAALLFYLLRLVSVSEVGSAFRDARWTVLLLVLPFALLNPVLSAARLKVLTDAQGMALSLGQIVGVNLISRFYGLLLPGHLGAGAVRWYRLVRLEDRKAAVLGAILASRVLHLLGLSALGLAFIAWDRPRVGGIAVLLGLPLLLGTAVMGALLLKGREIGHIASKLPLGEKLRDLSEKLTRFRRLSPRELGVAVGLSVAENLSGTLILYLSAVALGIALPLATLGWVRAVVQLIALIPVSFSGLGIREGGLLVALEPFGVPGSTAVALGLLVFAATLVVGLIGGLFELWLQLSRGGSARFEASRPVAPPESS